MADTEKKADQPKKSLDKQVSELAEFTGDLRDAFAAHVGVHILSPAEKQQIAADQAPQDAKSAG
jgi:hypothetical protein